MAGQKFDVSTPRGVAGFNGFMEAKSYVGGYSFSPADSEFFSKFASPPDVEKHPHAYRWYVHIASLMGGRGLAPAPPPVASPAAAAARTENADKNETNKGGDDDDDDDDDFDVFGGDGEGEDDEDEEKPKESRAEMLARLKAEAEARTAAKEVKQRTLVGMDVKPWGTEQDLEKLWKKITTEVRPEGLKWGETCHQVDIAYGIKKLAMTFTMGVNNSVDEVVEMVQGFEDEVQSVDVTSMNVL